MRINVLTVLYNCALSDSETLRSILQTNLESIKLNMIVWNNGPNLLKEQDIKNYLELSQNKGITTSIYQDVRNLSLSKIYNHFINKLDYDFFVIFDQDSNIDCSFFQNIYHNSHYAIVCPAIFPKQKIDKQCFPSDFEQREQVTPPGEFNLSNTRTINSGTALSKDLIDKLLDNHHYVFDEKFAFYHTDHRLFDLIHATPQTAMLKGLCIGKMYHDMTCEISYNELSERARLEIAYAKMLMRMYRARNPKIEVLRNLFYAYKMKKKDKLSIKSFLKLLKCVITKEHPRSYASINKNVKPINSNVSS
ncbi:hypothetical protein A9G48_06885 [Gilliamella sp. wkB18]|jgi:hypothetical protein|uniref:hypothetical protein n=1 Tax=Gilliamella sp. wkB18 TaxID=3120260 RepID=UPI0004DCBB0F|nr:hypothetical protein [Gilliamella apicola]KFA59435.1 putative glycosyl transferase [Gilliamella apicola]OCG62978.1 hypothetical protein A9G48_06885 [Gilliamella apicola]